MKKALLSEVIAKFSRATFRKLGEGGEWSFEGEMLDGTPVLVLDARLDVVCAVVAEISEKS